MCGLVGGVTKGNFGFTGPEQKVLNELLFMDTLRGPDSTGVCLVRTNYTARVIKKATWGPSFLCSKAFQETDTSLYQEGKFFMGHNRKATVGEITSENAHPFIVNNELVLMHNGSLTGHKHLADTAVDSEAIAQYLHQNWNDDATPEEKGKVLAKLGGAWALVWYDLRTEKLNIVRNAQRPLFIFEDKGLFFWASDEHMLRCALARNSFHGQIKAVPTYNVLTFSETGLQEVVLPTTAFFPQTYTPTANGGTTTTTKIYTANGWVSKNHYKKIIKELVGRKIVFNLEGTANIHGMSTFYGESTDLAYNHEIIGQVNDKLMLDTIEDNYGLAQGVVLSASHQKTTGYISIHVKLLGAYSYAKEGAFSH